MSKCLCLNVEELRIIISTMMHGSCVKMELVSGPAGQELGSSWELKNPGKLCQTPRTSGSLSHIKVEPRNPVLELKLADSTDGHATDVPP